MSSSDSFADRFVTFRNGMVMPTAAYLLLLDLECRGCQVQRNGDVLIVGPSDRLNDEDRGAIRRWKWHLLDHCTRTDLDQHLFRDDTATATVTAASRRIA